MAATRNDEELRRKEAELILAKERAERDQREREALESLKMRLESEKRKVEENLEAERAVGVDKDLLLERTKKHEVELEDEILALQADLDTLDSQLDRALKLQKESEEKHKTLQEAFNQAAEHLVRLESEQNDWVERETKLNKDLDDAQVELDILAAEKEMLEKQGERLKNLLAQREEDLSRAKERMESTMSDLDSKLSAEQRNKLVAIPFPGVFKLITAVYITGTLCARRLTRWRKIPVISRSSSLKWLVLPPTTQT